MFTMLRSLRQASRTLLRAPAFSVSVIVLLGVGIGANTAVFTFVRGVLLRPLAFSESAQLVALCEENAALAGHCVVSPPNALDYAARSRALTAIGQTRDWSFQLRANGNTRFVRGGLATPEIFGVLRAQPLHGRTFLADEQQQDRNKVVLLSYSLFTTFFGGDLRVVGSTIQLDREPFTVVGVMPPNFRMPGFDAELWTPLNFDTRAEDQRSWRGFMTIGRLSPGATIAQAQAELSGIAAQLGHEHPDTNEGWGISVTGLRAYLVKSVRPALVVFSVAVALLLLLTCANVAALLLVRATERQQEFALRVTLGANRTTLVRQVFNEALLLGAAAGVVAWGVTVSAVKAFLLLAPAGLPRQSEIAVDPFIVGFAFLLAIGTAVVVALIPTLRIASLDPYRSLREAGSRLTGRSGLKARRALVAIEVAVAVTLLVGSSLLMRSLSTLLDWQPGFDRTKVVVASSFTPKGRYPTADALALSFQRMEDALKAIPGVASTALVSAGPVFGGIEPMRFTVIGRTYASKADAGSLRFYDASPTYFQTVGLKVLRGRGLLESDRHNMPAVAVINEAAVRRYFSDSDPLHQRLRFELDDEAIEIVGVVSDMKPFDPTQPPEPEVYWSNRQRPRLGNFVVLRVTGETAGVQKAMNAAIERVDPEIQLSTARTIDEMVARRLVPSRFRAFLMSAFAVLALALAAAGLFGLLAYSVTLRLPEFGIRSALGARPSQLLRAVVGEGMRLTLAGLAAGIVASWALARLMTGLLSGIGSTDLLAYVVAVVLLLTVAFAATALPALRATRVQPMSALRAE